MDYRQKALELHQRLRGKIGIYNKINLQNEADLALVYTPGVAEPCKLIAQNKELAYQYTAKGNLLAVVTDGTAVLGLGNIGPEAALPVIEGKCFLFKEFADIDALPLCLGTTDVDEIVETIIHLAPTFGGINLEDISSPRCFAILRKLKQKLSIPVFHDDCQGTAVVVLAALINAAQILKRDLRQLEIVINGVGAAGIGIAELLKAAGLQKLILCTREGALYPCCPQKLVELLFRLAKSSNPEREKGKLSEVLSGADVFIGVSGPQVLNREMIRKMNSQPIIFALANPLPEIKPEEALAAGAFIVGTGRSDYPNQINNLLAFPGIFRGALAVQAKEINELMLLEAARALAQIIVPSKTRLLPKVFDSRVSTVLAEAVAAAAFKSGVVR